MKKYLIIAIFLASPTRSIYTNNKPTIEGLYDTLRQELYQGPSDYRWQKVIDLGNYECRISYLDQLFATLHKHGIDPQECVNAIVVEHQKNIDAFIAAKKNSSHQPSADLRHHVQKLLHTTYLKPDQFPDIITGTVDDMDDSPAAILSDLKNRSKLLIHTHNRSSSEWLKNKPYCIFTDLPETMQAAIIHHEIAHLPTALVDRIILGLATTYHSNNPAFLQKTYCDIETCVDMTAIKRSHKPHATAQGLYDFFTLCSQHSPSEVQNQQVLDRMTAIQDLQERMQRTPDIQVKQFAAHARIAAKAQAARFSTLVHAANNLIKHLPK